MIKKGGADGGALYRAVLLGISMFFSFFVIVR